MIPLLITRPDAQARRFAGQVEDRCPHVFRPIISPLLQIVREHVPVPLEGVQAVLFTSRNGVEAFAAATDERDIPALCVGDATARAAEAVGLSAMSASGDVAALEALAAASWRPEGGHYLYVHGAETAGDLAGALAAEGIPVEEVILYDQRPLELTDAAREALAGRATVVVPLFSPRSAALFADAVEEMPATAPMEILAISPAVVEALVPRPAAKIQVAEAPNAEKLIDLCERLAGTVS